MQWIPIAWMYEINKQMKSNALFLKSHRALTPSVYTHIDYAVCPV